MTEDEEIKKEIQELADQAASFAQAKKKVFDPEDSYFSEDESELAKDDIKDW